MVVVVGVIIVPTKLWRGCASGQMRWRQRSRLPGDVFAWSAR